MDKLKSIIAKGLVIDSIKSEQALYFYNLLAANAKHLNSNEENIVKLFGYLQQLSKLEFVISLARIFDKKSIRNNNRCFDSALYFLIKNHKSLIPSTDNQVFEHLDFYHIPEEISKLLELNNSSCFNLKIALYYQQKIEDNSQKINKIKMWRDKIIAHNEDYNKVISIPINEISNLLDLIWEFITIMGWIYLDTIYGIRGDYTIRMHSKFRSFDLKMLIDNL